VALFDMPGVFELDDGGYFLRGGNVVAGLDLEMWGESVEVPFKFM
jgi:hypothetical protein